MIKTMAKCWSFLPYLHVGLTIGYLLFLLHLLSLNQKEALGLFHRNPQFAPNISINGDRYDADCWDISIDRIAAEFDFYAMLHILNSAILAIVLRNQCLCWGLSLMWELCERAFMHVMPHLAECWFDSSIDVFILNSLGFWIGISFCRIVGLPLYRWEDMRWRWTKRNNTSILFKTLVSLILFLFPLLFMLNCFFILMVFGVERQEKENFLRAFLYFFITLPTFNYFNDFLTNPNERTLGRIIQITPLCLPLVELVVIMKLGWHWFAVMKPLNVTAWLLCLVTASWLYAVYPSFMPQIFNKFIQVVRSLQTRKNRSRKSLFKAKKQPEGPCGVLRSSGLVRDEMKRDADF